MPALAEVPAGFAAWLVAHQEAAQADGAAWERFRNDERTLYREILTALVQTQCGLCAYCEQRLTRSDGSLIELDLQVEHVLPKSGTPGRALDPHNLILCCTGGTYAHFSPERTPEAATRHLPPTRHNTSCGQAKADRPLPDGFDPRAPESTDRRTAVDLDGRLSADVPACARAGLSAATMDATIQQLSLNCERLRLARQTVRANVTEWVLPLLTLVLNDPHLTPALREAQTELTVAQRLLPDEHGHLRPFWTTEREVLEALSPGWVDRNRIVLGWPPSTTDLGP